MTSMYPKIDNSTKEERLACVLEVRKCLHDCEAPCKPTKCRLDKLSFTRACPLSNIVPMG